jgi:ferredoxin--NADP+ reductase
MYLRTRLPDNKRVCLLAKGVAASCTRQPSSFARQRLAVAPRFSSLQETMSAFLEERVLSVHHWTDRLFSFTTTRDTALRFSNGHFTMIGLKVDGKPLLRAYSIASPNYEEHLEFLSIKVPDGPLTSRLQNIQVGDTIIVGKKPTGTLLIDYLLPGKNLYLIGTGTGLAPWLAVARDPETYERLTTWSWCTACAGERAGLPGAVREGTARARVPGRDRQGQADLLPHGDARALPQPGPHLRPDQNGTFPPTSACPRSTRDRPRHAVRQPRHAGRPQGLLEKRGFQEGNTTTPGDFVVERAFVEK